MHYWCGKEWMCILHKSKGRLLFQECTGSDPPDKDLTYTHKNGHKWWMVVLRKEPRNATGPPVGAHPRRYPLHISPLHVWIHTKHESLLQTDNSYKAQVLTIHLSAPAKASQALYLLRISIVASGEMAVENWCVGGRVFASLNSDTRGWGGNGHGNISALAFSPTFEYVSRVSHRADVPSWILLFRIAVLPTFHETDC